MAWYFRLPTLVMAGLPTVVKRTTAMEGPSGFLFLFPLNSGWWLAGDIVDDAIDVGDFIDDAGANAF